MAVDTWDDLRFVIAVAEERTVSGAARRLGVNHATVLRRIAQFEDRAGTELFEKSARGYILPSDRQHILEAAREVDRAMQVVSRLLAGSRAPVSGEVRVTSTDSLCQILLPKAICRLSAQAPDVRLSLISSNAHLDLGRTHADLTVRPTMRLPPDLTGVRVGQLGFRVYAAPGAQADRWLALSGQLARTVPARWMAGALDPETIGDGADSFLTLRELAAVGRGRAILPTYVGDADHRLQPVPSAMPELFVDVWVASHVDLADIPRVSRMRDLLAAALAPELAPPQPGAGPEQQDAEATVRG